MKVFLASATGAIGRRLVPQLVEAGNEVTAMTRSKEKLGELYDLGAEPRGGRKWFLIAAAFTLFALLSAVGAVVGWSVLQNFNDGTVFVTAGLLFAFALILWAFAVLLWDLLEERMRAWIRVVLVALLAPACALTTALISAVAALALVTALESDRPTVGPSKPQHIPRLQGPRRLPRRRARRQPPTGWRPLRRLPRLRSDPRPRHRLRLYLHPNQGTVTRLAVAPALLHPLP